MSIHGKDKSGDVTVFRGWEMGITDKKTKKKQPVTWEES